MAFVTVAVRLGDSVCDKHLPGSKLEQYLYPGCISAAVASRSAGASESRAGLSTAYHLLTSC